MKSSLFFSICFLAALAVPVQAQVESDLRLISGDGVSEVGFLGTFSRDREQAFWLTHNRWGLFDGQSANALTYFSHHRPAGTHRDFDLGGGVTVLARGADRSTLHLHEGYLDMRNSVFRLRVGRFRATYGSGFDELSSGSTGMSRNAAPIPKITGSIPDFVEVPYTSGFMEIKGHFSHGWLETDRPVERAFLHEKSLYTRLGGELPFRVYGGLVHFAMWGGESSVHGKQPNSISDLLRVVIAKEGGEGALQTDQENSLGYHTGLWDWGIEADIGASQLHLYYQHLFTDGSGLYYRNMPDGLYGVGVRDPLGSNRLVTGILWEFLYTKHQSGAGRSDAPPGWTGDPLYDIDGSRFNGRDNYYNNGVYRNGWTYQNRTIGSPLFLLQRQLDRVDTGGQVVSDRMFVSNRVLAHHMALKGELNTRVNYRLFATWNRHHGTYNNLALGEPWSSDDPEGYFFNPPKDQWYFMVESHWRPVQLDGLTVTTALSLDRGDLFNNVGLLAGVSWTF